MLEYVSADLTKSSPRSRTFALKSILGRSLRFTDTKYEIVVRWLVFQMME